MGQVVLIGAVVAALVGLGMHFLAAPAGGNTTTITATNNVIMTIGAGETSLSPEQFKSVVEAAVSSRKELASATALVLKPARLDPEASSVSDYPL
ncbi:hypothetical protein ebA631 [Aromatoleum aromaticum EbN1]|uniref:Uncharacterized protein n=1 Tax=Aromatoleum aromaticum (strain DSM 19018 / LMG 30748 / EbN1) TaxID=76114 RepID=Q5P8A9_AROAE|nr:hypothetical protein ebA631 [Aromatoleum aromaticum EbN1]